MLKLCHKMTFNEGNFFVVFGHCVASQVNFSIPAVFFPKFKDFRNEYDELGLSKPSFYMFLHSGFFHFGNVGNKGLRRKEQNKFSKKVASSGDFHFCWCII